MNTRPLIVWLAGMPWDGPVGTEVRLAQALAADHADVLWVDPARSVWRASHEQGGHIIEVAPGLRRMVVLGPPGVTRPGVSAIAQRILFRRLAAQLKGGRIPSVVVLSDPTGAFPPDLACARVMFVTDDWVAGAPMLGLSTRLLRRLERRNAARATAVAAVSPALASTLESRTGASVGVLPNGCEPAPTGCAPAPLPLDHPIAGLVGNINERIDLDVLEAVVDRGVRLVVVGPLAARSSSFRARFSDLVARPKVHWTGGCSPSEVPSILAAVDVGLTPYVDSEFNRASFPLKTLEYLAAGLAVVSTRLPANAWLDTDLVKEAPSAAAFADEVVARLAAGSSGAEVRRRQDFARQHTWQQRTLELLEMAGVDPSSTPASSSKGARA